MNFLPATLWNRKYVEPLANCLVRPGTHTRVLYTARGQCVSLTAEALWRHPWFTYPRWNAQERHWEATVNAGFVNGIDPLVPGAGEKGADADLADDPVIPLRGFRSLPGEGDPVPPLFVAAGVRTKKDGAIGISDMGFVTIDSTPREEGLPPPRALVAMDFYLSVARPTYQPHVAVVDASGTSGSITEYWATFDTSTLNLRGARARLMQAAKMPRKHTPTFYERLSGEYQDNGEDWQLVSTVYLLSPPDQLDGPPDGTWEAFVAHEIFWNLAHASRNLPPAQFKPLRFAGTGLWMADMIVGQWLALQKDIEQRVFAAANASDNAGKFWSV